MINVAVIAFPLLACGGAPQVAQRITVDTVPAVDFTVANPLEDPLFEYPTGATQLSNGTVVVNDYYAARLLYFDSAGALLHKVGGRGPGPDAFGGALQWRGQCRRDSVYVMIFDRGQVAVLDSVGVLRRTYTAQNAYGAAPCVPESRTVRWQGELTQIPRAGDPPLRGELFIADLDGKNEISLGEFVIGEYGPARPNTQAFVRHDEVYVGSGESAEIEVYSTSGSKLRTLQLKLERPAMSDAHFEAALDQYVKYLVLHDERRRYKELFRQRYPKPARAGAFSSFYVDAQQVLWVTTSQPGEPTMLRAYSGDHGSPIGTYRFAVELRIFEIGERHLLAAFEDDEGFPHVARYRLMRQAK